MRMHFVWASHVLASVISIVPAAAAGQFAGAPERPGPGLQIRNANAPVTRCNAASIGTAFECDLSNVALAIRHSITGATTLGQPATGYQYTDNAYPVYGYLYNSSGWNNSLSGNNGRTSAAFSRVHVFQAGQGDSVAYNATAFLASRCRPGSTSFLACPAASLFNGDMQAGAPSSYLNPYETIIKDNGFGVAGIGNVNNLVRTVATRPLGDEWWAGYRAQSQGSVAADVAYSASGRFNIGLDLSFLSLPTTGAGAPPFNCVSCAITMAGDQRIYLNAAASDSTHQSRFPAASGNSWITFHTGSSALQVVTDNRPAALMNASRAFVYGATQLAAGSENRIGVDGVAAGSAPIIRVVTASDPNQDGVLKAAGTSGWYVNNASGSIYIKPSASANEIATTAGAINIHSAGGHTVLNDATVTVANALAVNGLAASSSVCTDASKHLSTNCGGAGAATAPAAALLAATTPAIGGNALAAGACSSATVPVPQSLASMAVVVTPVTYPGDAFYWRGYVSSSGSVTVKVCAAVAGMPVASAYNVRVIR